jgi:cytochrome c553
MNVWVRDVGKNAAHDFSSDEGNVNSKSRILTDVARAGLASFQGRAGISPCHQLVVGLWPAFQVASLLHINTAGGPMRASLQFVSFVAATAASAVIAVNGAAPIEGRQTPVSPPSDVAARMRDHYGQVLTVHAAVIRGDLPAIAAPARALAERLGSGGAVGPGDPVAAIRSAAERAASAKDVPAAASATAAMLGSCGDCHLASGVMPAAALPRLPIVGGVVGRMKEHQRAVEQMLQGLVVPSNSLWREGAEGFATASLHPSDLPAKSVEQRQMTAVEDRLRQVAKAAATAPAGEARVIAYATLLATCADCHSRHAKVWGPGRGGPGR